MQRLESLCVASMHGGCPETVLDADPGASWPMGGQSVFWLVGGLAKEWSTSQDFWRTLQKQVWDSRWLVPAPPVALWTQGGVFSWQLGTAALLAWRAAGRGLG